MAVFFISIFFEIFRMPILAFFNLQSYGFLVHVLVILSLFFCARGFRPSVKELKFYYLWLFFSGISLYLLTLIDLRYKESWRQLFSIMTPAVVPIILVSLKFDEKKFVNMLEKLLGSLFYVGSFYIIVEWVLLKNQIFDQCKIASWFHGAHNSQYCNSGRPMVTGFYVFKDISLALIVATFFSFKDWSNKKIIGFRAFLLLINLIIVDSITIFFLVLPLTTLKFYKKIKGNVYLFYLVFIVIAFFFQFTYTYTRIHSYFIHELDLSRFLPEIAGCQWGRGILIDARHSEFCDSREIHSMFYLFKFGLMPTIFWYSMIAHSAWIAMCQFLKNRQIMPILYFNVTMTMAMVHYSGIEGWGVNFLVASIYLLTSKSSVKREFSSLK